MADTSANAILITQGTTKTLIRMPRVCLLQQLCARTRGQQAEWILGARQTSFSFIDESFVVVDDMKE